MKKEWNVKIDGRDMNQVEIINALMESRGIKDYDSFINPTDDAMIPFDEMSGLKEGCDIILKTLENDGKFVVFFDVDDDGVSSGAIMTRYLRHYTDKIDTYINQGKKHGAEDFPLEMLDEDTTLIIVDSLNNNPEVYRKILATGTQLIVCDHHLIEQQLIDANLPFCLISSANNYPNPALSGAGVVFKFCQYIDEETWNDYADELWDLAASGIVADMCDLSEQSSENRYICYKGFQNQKNLAISKINGTYGFDSKAVSFGIAPLVNAACRTNENKKAMQLFLSDDPKEVNALIKELKNCKEKQNKVVDDQMDNLIEQGNAQLDQKAMYFFIDGNLDVEAAGLMANRLLEKYQRPLFVLKTKGKNYEGSMRAIGLDDFAKIVNDTGIGSCVGHELAAGAVIPIDRFEEFKARIEDELRGIEFVQSFDVDIQLDVDQVTDSLIQQIKEINKISGTGFPPIIVMIGEVSDYEIGSMSNGKHLKISTPNMIFIKWNFSGWDDMWDLEDKEFYGVGQLDSGCFGRTYYRQLILNDFKFKDIW